MSFTTSVNTPIISANSNIYLPVEEDDSKADNLAVLLNQRNVSVEGPIRKLRKANEAKTFRRKL